MTNSDDEIIRDCETVRSTRKKVSAARRLATVILSPAIVLSVAAGCSQPASRNYRIYAGLRKPLYPLASHWGICNIHRRHYTRCQFRAGTPQWTAILL